MFILHSRYQMFATTLSALYGKLLVVMGIAFPMSEVISTYIPPSFYEVIQFIHPNKFAIQITFHEIKSTDYVVSGVLFVFIFRQYVILILHVCHSHLGATKRCQSEK